MFVTNTASGGLGVKKQPQVFLTVLSGPVMPSSGGGQSPV